MVRLALGLALLGALAPARAQGVRPADEPASGPVVVFGTVTDVETGEPLAGAAVAAVALGRGALADSLGRYRLALPSDTVRLTARMAGYEPVERPASEAVGGRLDWALAPVDLGEVLVEAATDAAAEAVAPGAVVLSGRDVQALPALLGEADVLKAVQTLPGVRGGQEGTAGLYVRGGSPDQTLVLLDGVPIYNASHLFGFLSTFHAGAVGDVALMKAVPARHGGRLAAVLDVETRAGSLDRRRAEGQVGLLAASGLVEGPVVPGRLSVLVAGRRAHVDAVARPFLDAANREARAQDRATVEPSVAFYDGQARAHWRPLDGTTVDLSAYAAGDAFAFLSSDPRVACGGGACAATGVVNEYGGALDWRTRAAALRVRHRLSGRATLAVGAHASGYAFDVDASQTEGRGGPAPQTAVARYRSGIDDLSARADLDLAVGRHAVRAGLAVTRHVFTPGALTVAGDEATDAPESGAPAEDARADTTLGANRTAAAEVAGYAEGTWRFGPVTAATGLRVARYATDRFAYPSVEPRLAVAVAVGGGVHVRASAERAQQPVHLLTTGAGIGLPADLWVPADSVGPERGEQVSLGVDGVHGAVAWSLAGYGRRMRGLVAYRDGAAFTTAFEDWQDLVVTGEGRSRGVEALVRLRTGRVAAQVAYTLARADRQFDAVAGGRRFPYRYDRRHDVTATATARAARWLDVSAAVAWATGDAVTLPSASYDATFLAPGSVGYWTASVPQAVAEVAFGPRNGHRLPDYLRLDLGATVFFRRGERPHALALSVYNATNRKNPFVTTLDERTDPATGTTRRQLVGVSLFPVLPSLAYRFSF